MERMGPGGLEPNSPEASRRFGKATLSVAFVASATDPAAMPSHSAQGPLAPSAARHLAAGCKRPKAVRSVAAFRSAPGSVGLD
jgi:hypothetical protein